MKKLMLLIAVFMLGSTGIVFAQEPVKTDKPATEQTENQKNEEGVNEEGVNEEGVNEEEGVTDELDQQTPDNKDENKAEKVVTDEQADEVPAQSAE